MEDFISFGLEPKKAKTLKKGKILKRVPKAKKIANKKQANKVASGMNAKNTVTAEPKERKPSMKLQFEQSCPEAEEIYKLHPLIQYVFIPHRKKSIRHCTLRFDSVEDREQVRSALNKKHIDPFKGLLRCYKTQYDTISEIRAANPNLLNEKYLTSIDIKHAKSVHQPNSGATIDVKLNSTARELFVRYGVGSPVIKVENDNSTFAPPMYMDEEEDSMSGSED